jgi:hypothetical protein
MTVAVYVIFTEGPKGTGTFGIFSTKTDAIDRLICYFNSIIKEFDSESYRIHLMNDFTVQIDDNLYSISEQKFNIFEFVPSQKTSNKPIVKYCVNGQFKKN